MSKRVGFVGLGTMGGPMAGHLHSAGQSVVVWNRTAARAESLRGAGVEVAASLSELAAGCDVVFLCVNRSEDVWACVSEMAGAAKPGTLFVDHSTISPDDAKRIALDLVKRGFRFVDAPITGGSMGAQKGQLTIFLGGTEDDVAEAMQFAKPYTKRAERVGPAGSGQLAKMVNQIAVGGALLGLCESLSFAKKAGLDLAQIRDMISGGAGGSWAYANYGSMILAEDWRPGFSVKNQRKDFGYARRAAISIDAAIPGADLVDRLLAKLEDAGHGEWTTAALYTVMLELGADA